MEGAGVVGGEGGGEERRGGGEEERRRGGGERGRREGEERREGGGYHAKWPTVQSYISCCIYDWSFQSCNVLVRMVGPFL